MPLVQWIMQNLNARSIKTTGDGGVALSGAALAALQLNYQASGGLITSGAADAFLLDFTARGAGGVYLDGEADYKFRPVYPLWHVELENYSPQYVQAFNEIYEQILRINTVVPQPTPVAAEFTFDPNQCGTNNLTNNLKILEAGCRTHSPFPEIDKMIVRSQSIEDALEQLRTIPDPTAALFQTATYEKVCHNSRRLREIKSISESLNRYN